MPDDISEELNKDPAAKAIWDKLPPSHQREYLKWINEAKKPATRTTRIQKMLQMLSSGQKNPR